jgi:chromodomain-helicase-DNA-binding protein 1
MYVVVCVLCLRRAVLPVELLHGITFACGWGAGTINSKRVAPPELAATMQGIFQGMPG